MCTRFDASSLHHSSSWYAAYLIYLGNSYHQQLDSEDAHDVLRAQRERASEQSDTNIFPQELLRRYELRILLVVLALILGIENARYIP